MGHTLVTFQGEYFEYGADDCVDEKGLTIGGYKSAWLADLVAGYVLENCGRHFREAKYHGIYPDDGILVFPGKWRLEAVSE